MSVLQLFCVDALQNFSNENLRKNDISNESNGLYLLLCSSNDRFELRIEPHRLQMYFASLCTSICFRRSALLKNRFGHFEQATGLNPECRIV